MKVTGTLVTGELAEMRFERITTTKGRRVWCQRAASDTAKHLNRDYIGGESFEKITRRWLPCDWKDYKVDVGASSLKCAWGEDDSGEDDA